MDKQLSDAEVVRVARRIDRLNRTVADLVCELRDGALNGDAIEDALNWNEIPALAWAVHVVHDHLQHPERWETGNFGIRRKKKGEAQS